VTRSSSVFSHAMLDREDIEGSAEFPGLGNSAAFLGKKAQSLKDKTLRYPLLRCPW
jgi:hypothetical protein